LRLATPQALRYRHAPRAKDKNISDLIRASFSLKNQASVFFDPLSITVADPEHSIDEQRFVITGVSYQRRALVVVHVDRGDRIRIISARRATPTEMEKYESEAE